MRGLAWGGSKHSQTCGRHEMFIPPPMMHRIPTGPGTVSTPPFGWLLHYTLINVCSSLFPAARDKAAVTKNGKSVVISGNLKNN